ncbi:hypothetical protein [Virgibacillus oceani]|uniref:Uncharacterized protein n=1 Tax=Virgibacillus oceani TaxID=1479511 RepID=A0A917M5R3_9BACI|nr:hypothetical protein [Virgibacillus oceani]GGG78946.1 hypothetical protein GCM10011398_25330 [Virgibacillus oceani]
METLSKLWVYNKDKVGKQRDVSTMKEHRQKYGLSGNCFDLAIWLLDEFNKDGIEAYPIGHDLNTVDAHVAVIALNDLGNRYLCDLGDQWIMPILMDEYSEDFSNGRHSGFFPAANIQVTPLGENVEILYYWPNGKVSKQVYDTTPIERGDFFKAAENSQNMIRPTPLIEYRLPYKNEIAHWEFDNWEINLSTTEGLYKVPTKEMIGDYVENISSVVGFDRELLYSLIEQYREWK